MDFEAWLPEINVRLRYSGPGSDPMLAAVAARDRLAAELQSAASSYGSVRGELRPGCVATVFTFPLLAPFVVP